MTDCTELTITPNNPAMINGETLTFTATPNGDVDSYEWYVDEEAQNHNATTFAYTPDYTATNTTHTIKCIATIDSTEIESEVETVVVVNVGYYYYHMLIDLDAVKKAVE